MILMACSESTSFTILFTQLQYKWTLQSSSHQESAVAPVHRAPLPCMCMHPTATPGLMSFIHLTETANRPPPHTHTSGC